MTTSIEIRHFKPEIDIRIVHFTLGLRCVLLLPRACDHNKLAAKPTGGMAMSRMLHRVAFHKLVVIVDLNLIKRVKCIIVTLVITTTN